MSPSPLNPDLLYLPAEAAAAIRSNPRTLERWRREGSGPSFIRLGKRRVAYRGVDLVAWLNGRVRQHTAQDRYAGAAA